MSYKNIASAFAVAAILGVSGTAYAEPNDNPGALVFEETTTQMESSKDNMTEQTQTENVEYHLTDNHDDRA